MGVERAKPSACRRNRCGNFFTAEKRPRPNRRRQATQNIVQKEKVFNVGSAFRGALSLAERPSLAEQSPGLFRNSLPAERTASSASRKCVSFFGIPDWEGFSSCEKAYESVPCANKGLCPFETCKSFLPDKLALRICYANSIRKIK